MDYLSLTVVVLATKCSIKNHFVSQVFLSLLGHQVQNIFFALIIFFEQILVEFLFRYQ